MAIVIKEHVLGDILQHIEKYGFTADGCDCGEWAYQLEKDLFLMAYRSCRKSGGTPEEKLWHISDLEFYKKVAVNPDYLEAEPENKTEMKLNRIQYEIIMNKLKKVSVEETGYLEYRDA